MRNILTEIRGNVAEVMVGKEKVTDLLLVCLAAGGHVLLEDIPGSGKTVLARSLAKSLDLRFGRIQFTPDLLPGDVTGLSYYNREKGKFVFREGPVFAQVLLADEINRATPRTQSALLECMGEGQVTVDGTTRELGKPFFVIATQNPVETLGCFPLPEAQLDRFLMKISMGELSAEEERRMIDRFIVRDPLPELKACADAEAVLDIQRQCREVFVHSDLRDYITALAQKSRTTGLSGLREGISPRGTLALLRAAQGFALLDGRDYAVPEDIHNAAVPVLAHRFLGEETSGTARAEKIRQLLRSVPVPTEDWERR